LFVELPTVDRESVEHVVTQVTSDSIAREMDILLPLLWTNIVGPLAEHLEPGALVTLIAGGALTELPLHMAGTYPDGDDVWRDRTGGIVFRYAPNARVLLRAQRTRRALDGEELRVLTAAVPAAPGQPRLPYAPAESEGVAASFPPGHAERPTPPTVANVQRCLNDCEVWHFACHGIHDPVTPLDSKLELEDGHLTLRAMFARPSGRRRLAVLSACHSATLGASLPDEVVGFPSAMLQAGVAGVIACHAEVDDYPTMLLVRAFFARLRRTDTPARALADAQAWLRTATNADIRDAFPKIHETPEDELDRFERWEAHRPYKAPSDWALFSYTGA
jgi:CHAT domain-containing protein